MAPISMTLSNPEGHFGCLKAVLKVTGNGTIR